MSRASVVNSHEILAAERRTGTIWAPAPLGDLNMNLLRFPVGEGVGKHVNDEVDVEELAYLTVHRQRGPLQIGRR
jgi:hypothetical protein